MLTTSVQGKDIRNKDMAPRYTDRSRIVTDWVCPRKRHWQYEYQGKGIVRDSINQALHTGSVIHDSLAAIAAFHKEDGKVDINKIALTAAGQMRMTLQEAMEGEMNADEYSNEQAALVEGLLRGFYKHVWPRLMEQYPTIVAIEQECEYKLEDDLIFMSKPDLILESKDGEWHYIEYKSTSSKKNEWIESWETAVQLHSSVKAVEATMGKAPSDVTIVGLYKGYVSYGKQSSPMCYAYMKKGNPPFTEDVVSYEYKAGLRRYPTWELEGGTAKWVDEMDEVKLAEQFPMTPPIFINDDLVKSFFNQTAKRENEIAVASLLLNSPDDSDQNEALLDRVFPQRFDQCKPAYGFSCEFRKLCHGCVTNPLEEGYQYRQPHHQAEMEAQESNV